MNFIGIVGARGKLALCCHGSAEESIADGSNG